MHELLHRSAVAALLLSGALTAFMPADMGLLLDPAAASLLAHRQFMLGLLGAGLLVAVFVPSWRLPAVGAAIVSKAALLIIFPGAAALESTLLLLLLAAAMVFAREAWQEARWHGMLPLRPEA